ncbi:hypothetical protein SAMD00019534_060500 [Acytostelium subglobosum LB1]|uniref:hypothetical protein n=1 Tax=Acytostelium subglobosum LB1 TaxID=1410327 RepID=UPI0006449729|nr:hypothetical protein SAMD00019534_060500 [Acytostelium subglobosum LB1]GAM22875.1 hypothetical protein SAMD00019534_060500 [Acytostelium subglobosum LB1]|eukprot:XP_012754102.1 hypothetical protein SAMD00019534_060500 [Acytostelium subglobosum LB1]
MLFSTIDVFQHFFPPLSQIFICLFTFQVAQSSDSFLVIIENVLRTTFGAFIGCFGAYIIYQMADHILWITIILHFIFIFITSSLTKSTSKWLPFQQAKFLFLSLFVILYSFELLQKNTTVFLRYFVCSIAMLVSVFTACIIFNPYFSSTLFMRYSGKVIARSRKLFELAGQELINRSDNVLEAECDIRIPSTNMATDQEYRATIINRIRNQATMSRYTVKDPFFPLETVPEYLLNTSQVITIDESNKVSVAPSVPEASAASKYVPNPKFSEDVIALAVKYSKGLNTLYKYLAEAKKEEWTESIISKLEEMAFQLDRNHKKVYDNHVDYGKDDEDEIRLLLLILQETE